MYLKMNWHITIDKYYLGMLDGVEIHQSVDLLADTCTIKLPATMNNKPIQNGSLNVIEDDLKKRITRGQIVKVWLGYNKPLFGNLTVANGVVLMQQETPAFEGHLLNISTDDGSLILTCEDDMFLMRKPVRNKGFDKTTVKEIVQYLITETDAHIKLNCTLTINYDSFHIIDATAFDVLKKLKEDTAGVFYMRKINGVTYIEVHPPYIEVHGYVAYSFQQNIEKSDLKYKSAEDRKVQVVVEYTGKDGNVTTVTSGTTGGEKINKPSTTGDKASMKIIADAELKKYKYDGFEGSITTWLVPYVRPGYSAKVTDEDYKYKEGIYYVNSVTTSFDGSSGGVRKVQLGIRLS